ncbi:hypothetical protein [Paludibacterium denitrificans]|uniref:hypothetical protein n=1 Tax=Paludibacterium denitrificans TaxID=2675226 RepID=UPI001E445B73|nr:hypothetical protein [Paludibacterium denitrificans]
MLPIRPLIATALYTASFYAAADTTLTVYTALEADQLKAYQQKFEKENPGHQTTLGARLHRRDHGQAVGRKIPTASRRGNGSGSILATGA